MKSYQNIQAINSDLVWSHWTSWDIYTVTCLDVELPEMQVTGQDPTHFIFRSHHGAGVRASGIKRRKLTSFVTKHQDITIVISDIFEDPTPTNWELEQRAEVVIGHRILPRSLSWVREGHPEPSERKRS